jgi:GDP-L-fucose synthase
MIRKFVEAEKRGAPEVVLWGTGEPTREFLYVDDAARALLLAAERLRTSEPVNVGTGHETKIRDLAESIRTLVGFDGEIVWDSTKPDGQPARYLDVTRARDLMGFEATTSLEDGLRRTIDSYASTLVGTS